MISVFKINRFHLQDFVLGQLHWRQVALALRTFLFVTLEQSIDNAFSTVAGLATLRLVRILNQIVAEATSQLVGQLFIFLFLHLNRWQKRRTLDLRL